MKTVAVVECCLFIFVFIKFCFCLLFNTLTLWFLTDFVPEISSRPTVTVTSEAAKTIALQILGYQLEFSVTVTYQRTRTQLVDVASETSVQMRRVSMATSPNNTVVTLENLEENSTYVISARYCDSNVCGVDSESVMGHTLSAGELYSGTLTAGTPIEN